MLSHLSLPLCDRIPDGNYELGAPVIGETILLGTNRAAESTRLGLTVEPSEIRIFRLDGKQLIVDEVLAGFDGSELRTPVIGRSAITLVLTKDGQSGIWDIKDRGSITIYSRPPSEDGLEHFINLVVSCALDKPPHDEVPVNDLLELF